MPEGKGPRPAVFARLRHDEEARQGERRPPRGTRWVGLIVIVAIIVVVAWAVVHQAAP